MRADWRKMNIPHKFSVETQLQRWLDELVLRPLLSLKAWLKWTLFHALCSKMKTWTSKKYHLLIIWNLTELSGSFCLPGGAKTHTTKVVGFPVISHRVLVPPCAQLSRQQPCSSARAASATQTCPSLFYIAFYTALKHSHFSNFIVSACFETEAERGCNSYERNSCHYEKQCQIHRLNFKYEENVCDSKGFGHGEEQQLLLHSPVLSFPQWVNKKNF